MRTRHDALSGGDHKLPTTGLGDRMRDASPFGRLLIALLVVLILLALFALIHSAAASALLTRG